MAASVCIGDDRLQRLRLSNTKITDAGMLFLEGSPSYTLRLKLNDIALHDKSSQSYEASLAVWDHTVLPARLPPDTSELALPNPSQTGWYSIYLPRRDGRLS